MRSFLLFGFQMVRSIAIDIMEPTIQKRNIPIKNIKIFRFWMAFSFPSLDYGAPTDPLYV